ncbi:MAG: hypothetical protein HY775_07540 [Acidobacteria bacterium]|nr:hypothetical protein [Acidobacteriota bacterium]
MKPSDRLSALSAEIERAQTELRILEEQLAFQDDVAEDARLRAIVAETPLADREARGATEDAERTRRLRDEVAARVDGLRAEQDRLLERLFEQPSAGDR